MNRADLESLARFLPARDAGWTDAQACAFLARQGLRAQAATRRLLAKRNPELSLPESKEGLMAFVEMLLDQPKHHKTWVTNPERRAIRLWHRVVRASDQAQALAVPACSKCGA